MPLFHVWAKTKPLYHCTFQKLDVECEIQLCRKATIDAFFDKRLCGFGLINVVSDRNTLQKL